MRCACFLRLCETGEISFLKRLHRFSAEKYGLAVRISPCMGKRKCAAMRHWIESPFYPQGACHIRSDPTSLTAVQSFRLAEKKTAIHGQKKRRWG